MKKENIEKLETLVTTQFLPIGYQLQEQPRTEEAGAEEGASDELSTQQAALIELLQK